MMNRSHTIVISMLVGLLFTGGSFLMDVCMGWGMWPFTNLLSGLALSITAYGLRYFIDSLI